MGCQEDGAIVLDLMKRFGDPNANQLSRWSIDARPGVPPITNRMLSQSCAWRSLSKKDFLTVMGGTAEGAGGRK
jgi:hypothetical protein